MTTTEAPVRSLAAAGWTIPVALGAALLAGLVAADVGGPLRSVLAVVLVLGGGVGLGPLLLVTPVEPSPIKLWLFSALLGPPLVAGTAWLAASPLGLGPELAWAAPLALSASLTLLASRRRLGVSPPGRAALLSVGIGAAGAAGAWLLLSSTAGLHALLEDHAVVVHTTLADAAARGEHDLNPWFFGGHLDLRPAVGQLLAAVAAPAGLPAESILPLLLGWSVLVLGMCGYLAAAAAFREQTGDRAGDRDLLACALVVLLVGLLPLLGVLRAGTLLGAGSPGLDPGAALARTYGAAALLAGLHAVRRGARPWPLLAALLTGVAALGQPWLGPVLCFAIGIPGAARGRPMVLPLLLLASLPAFWVGRTFGGFTLDQTWGSGPPEPLSLAALFALGGPAALALVRWGRPGPVATSGLAVLLLAPCVMLLLPPAAAWDQVALGHLALFPAALLAAGGLAGGSAGGSSLRRLVGPAAAVALAASCFTTGEPRSIEAGRLVIGRGGLELTGDPDLAAGLGDAFTRARAIRAEDPGPAALLRGGAGGRVSGGAPSLAPLLAGTGLWVDEAAPPGTSQPRAGAARRVASGETDLGDRWVDRRELLDALFRDRNAWEPRFDRLLRAEVSRGTTLLFLVTEQDRRRTTDRGTGPRGTDAVLLRLGAERVHEGPEVALYRLGD